MSKDAVARIALTAPHTSETVDTMPVGDLERRVCHAQALLEQAEAMLPGIGRLRPDTPLVPSSQRPGAVDHDWLTRRAVLGRLARRAAQLGARLTDAAWCMEQQARAELMESASAQPEVVSRVAAET